MKKTDRQNERILFVANTLALILTLAFVMLSTSTMAGDYGKTKDIVTTLVSGLQSERPGWRRATPCARRARCRTCVVTFSVFSVFSVLSVVMLCFPKVSWR